MTDCDLKVVNSKYEPLKRITVELYDSANNLVTIEKTNENGYIYFTDEVIDNFVIDPEKYASNKNYKKASGTFGAIHTTQPLTNINEYRYVVSPEINREGERAENMVCTWYDKNDKPLGSDTSTKNDSCNLFRNKTDSLPTYFKLTTKKGEKKKYKDADSRYNYHPPLEVLPDTVMHVRVAPVD